jgi:hypothetical protein
MKKILTFAASLALAICLRTVAHAQGVPSFQSANCAQSPQYGLASACWDTTLLQWFGWDISSKAYVPSNSSLPLTGNPGDMLFFDGTTWQPLPVSGDLIEPSLGSLVLGGINGIPFSGTAPSVSIAGQSYRTDGAGHYITATTNIPVSFGFSGTPTSGQPLGNSVPAATKFNADFVASTGVAASNASCATSPGSTATWNISCGVAGVWTQIGTVVLGTTCTNTSGSTGTGVTFATTSHTAKTCDAGRIEADAADANNGGSPVILLVGHL